MWCLKDTNYTNHTVIYFIDSN